MKSIKSLTSGETCHLITKPEYMDDIHDTTNDPIYIRCLKMNTEKISNNIEPQIFTVVYTGMRQKIFEKKRKITLQGSELSKRGVCVGGGLALPTVGTFGISVIKNSCFNAFFFLRNFKIHGSAEKSHACIHQSSVFPTKSTCMISHLWTGGWEVFVCVKWGRGGVGGGVESRGGRGMTKDRE